MLGPFIKHEDIVHFAEDHVNLKREDAESVREQVNRLRDRLEVYLRENPAFALRKLLLSGSLAKGTALKTINDVDVATYIAKNDAPSSMCDLIPWLAEKLRNAFPNFKPEQVTENEFTVTVAFSDSGLRVDVVPILYDGDPNWKGYMVSKSTGKMVLTSIPMHLDFIRRRKKANEIHYSQVVRLVKYWVQQRKEENKLFRFKSFMIELIVAHLADHGRLSLSDYPEALAELFAYIAKDSFRSSIVFEDHYSQAMCPACDHSIRIWDPVNHENNVAKLYTNIQRDVIIDAALEAGDAVDAALRAPTKGAALRYWQKVFGPAFDT